MKNIKTRTLGAATLLMAGLALSACAATAPTTGTDSEEFPAQDITLIVPYSAGGGTDTITRTIAPALEERLDANIQIVNRPGGSGAVAINEILTATPDGYTVIMGAASPLIAAPLFNDVGYVPSDLTPIGRAVATPNVLIVTEASPYQSAEEFFKAIEGGERLTVGVSGATSMQAIVINLLNESLGTDIVPIPFDGAAGAIAAVRAGDVDATMATTLDVGPTVTSGDATIIAATDPSGVAEQLGKDIPSLADQGVELSVGSDWYGLMGPAGLPVDVVAQWSEALEYALELDDVTATLNGMGATPGYLSPEEFGTSINRDWETYQGPNA